MNREELIERIKAVRDDGYLSATYLGNEHVGDLMCDVLAALEQGEAEGFYVIPNIDSPDQDSLWDGTIHPNREAAQASIDGARAEWGQDAENYHVVALMPISDNGDTA